MDASAQQATTTRKVTRKGARTRARIVDAAARLMHERGVAGTTVEEVRAAAAVSGSQLYHYFADKDALVQAVVDRQADAVVAHQTRADLATPEGRRAWRDAVIAHATHAHGAGGCPLGALGGQLAESDARARAQVADGFGRWATAIGDALRASHAAGRLAADVSPDDLAVTLLAALQGGLLLAQVQRDTAPLATALDTILALAGARDGAPRADVEALG